MANPEAKKTIINVKGADVEQWERAKTAANRADETMGEWLSRAVKHLADMEEGGREFPPGSPPHCIASFRERALYEPVEVPTGKFGEDTPSHPASQGDGAPRRTAVLSIASTIPPDRTRDGYDTITASNANTVFRDQPNWDISCSQLRLLRGSPATAFITAG